MKYDELRDHIEAIRLNRLDVLVFVGAFVTGVASYMLLHVGFHFPQWIVTAVIISVMLSYAAVVVCVPRLRVRLDQAGDNAYYLGLLLTLMSMAFALYEFGTAIANESGQTRDQSGAQQIIANFGIALGTTITGIFLRVFLHQMRIDPGDVESMTRIELTESSKKVRATLEAVTNDLALFHDEVRQRSSDMVGSLSEETKKSVETVNRELERTTNAMLHSVANAQENILKHTKQQIDLLGEMAVEAKAAIERLRAVEPPPLTLSRRLDKVAKVLEAAGDQTQRVVDSVGRRLEQDREVLNQLEEQSKRSVEESARAQAAAVEVLTRLTVLARALTSTLNAASS